jgi:hypothetical protein
VAFAAEESAELLIPMTECDFGWALNCSLGVSRKTSLPPRLQVLARSRGLRAEFPRWTRVAEIFTLTSMTDMRRINRVVIPTVQSTGSN